ncbi:DUF4240 domain-containing protein [Cellulophaga lytica]|uniref:DUF4240 domain-containing protein n=1 Tax=Cellulophaga lytica TaxID=979 RepID=UPI0009504CDA|nr:DUF4240 domain-containing protein [Cellulophaga lytica]APU09080.1 hypothetical protein A5M85_01875 [Cellulophaga lytica]MDO6853673.1 DUF4240 domain-containing protein [Cellulophaga lytica]
MEEEQFWKIIEQSWEDSPQIKKLRDEAKDNEASLEQLSYKLEEDITENYIKRLSKLGKEELTEFIHFLEERIYHIDRKEIHTYTDGSDDGFLYCRCFILGMGKDYYNSIDNNPSKAKFDIEAEGFGFSAYQVYEELFNEEFDRYSSHSMESCSNSNGWSE